MGELSSLECLQGFFACGAKGRWCWVDEDGFVGFASCDGFEISTSDSIGQKAALSSYYAARPRCNVLRVGGDWKR